MARFYDISDWEEHEYLGTGGTRDKVVVENSEVGSVEAKLSAGSITLNVLGDKNDYNYDLHANNLTKDISGLNGISSHMMQATETPILFKSLKLPSKVYLTGCISPRN